MDLPEVQLCEQHTRIADDIPTAISRLARTGFAFESKIDGVRALAYVKGGRARLVNRRGVDTSHRWPELVAALEVAYPKGCVLFDGEICCLNAAGHPDFAATHRRDAQSAQIAVLQLMKAYPASYLAFDLLAVNKRNLRYENYEQRNKFLTVESQLWHPSLPLRTVTRDADGHRLWAQVMAHNGEGLIAKRLTSPYTPGRSSSWVKIKRTFRISAVGVGYTEGQGSRAGGVGAVELALIGPDGPIPWGRVGTGFTERALAEIKRRMDAGELLVFDVEIQGLTADAQPRFPASRGIRSDVLPVDCVIGQLHGIPVC